MLEHNTREMQSNTRWNLFCLAIRMAVPCICLFTACTAGIAPARAQQLDCDLWSHAGAGDFDILAAMLQHCSNVNDKSSAGTTPLADAISWDHTDVALLLLQHHADPNLRLDGTIWKEEAPLIGAADNNNTALVMALLDAGADVDAQEAKGFTALMLAAYSRNVAMVRLLLQAHADPNLKDFAGRTALTIAINRAFDHQTIEERDAGEQIARDLFQAGADPSLSKDTMTWAVALANLGVLEGRQEEKSFLKELLAAGGNVQERRANPLLGVVNDLELGQILVDHGALVEMQGDNGMTPLMTAAKTNDLDQVKTLLALGADPNNNGHGQFPLSYAVENNDLELVRLLLENGANVNAIALQDGFLKHEKEIPNAAMRQLLQANWQLLNGRLDPASEELGASITSALNRGESIPRGGVPASLFNQALEVESASPSNHLLQTIVLLLGQGIESPPAVPAEALRHEATGSAAYEHATTRSDILAAAAEYQKAVQMAPWVPAYYRNLCVLYLLGGASSRSDSYCSAFESTSSSQEKSLLERQIAPYRIDPALLNPPVAPANTASSR